MRTLFALRCVDGGYIARFTPTALQLRALGVMHEAVQENATIVLMPNNALNAADALSAVAAAKATGNGPAR